MGARPGSMLRQDQLRRRMLMTEFRAGEAQALRDWWEEKCRADIDSMVPKAIEYGGGDLTLMADGMRLLQQVGGRTVTRPVQREAAIAFYALGKIARILSAISEGRLPGEDSWYDLQIYAIMAQYERQVGPWPNGVPE
jgi:hypothetical protein